MENNNLSKTNEINFENIKHIDENGTEFWYARELMVALGYSKWGNFSKVIDKAKISCETAGISVLDCFADVGKPIISGKGKTDIIADYKLTRYACYLIAQNGDPRKKQIALAQTYFAVQTRKQEITEEEYKQLSEDEKRMYNRNLTKKRNSSLFEQAQKSGVQNFGKFNNAGYLGLYNETASQIKKRKNLKNGQDILDYMESEELGANIFRITQTEARLKKDEINDENSACATHNRVGKAVRNAIKEVGGTMPEDLATPEKSIKELEREKKKQKRLQAKNTKKLNK